MITKCGTKALVSNTIVTSKIEMKKLEFNVSKCKKIHIGKENVNCCDLKVHNQVMEVSEAEKYLGEIVMKKMMNMDNIKNKEAIGMAAIAQIMSLLREVSLGAHYF